MLIEARGLCVRRLERNVLHEVSLRLEGSGCVCIVGPNGAGKSTLMSALLGLLPAAGGEVLLDGQPIQGLARRQVARRIAYVPQMHEGYLGFSAREIIESARYAWLDALDPLREADLTAIQGAAEAAHVEHLLDRPVDTLSGGERQKVWIAAALAQGTPALFLDEPTNALDPAHQAELIRLVRGLSAAGRLVVVISHDLNLPLALGGRVLALRDGRLVLDVDAESLADPPALQSIFEAEFSIHRDDDGRQAIHLKV